MRSAPSFRIWPPPPSQKIAASRAEPIRLPTQLRTQVRASAARSHEPRATPIVSAMPKQLPMTRPRRARLDLLAEREDEDNADADISARNHRGNEEGAGRVAGKGGFFGRHLGEVVERLGEHRDVSSAVEDSKYRSLGASSRPRSGDA
jgi:hypothetical protein